MLAKLHPGNRDERFGTLGTTSHNCHVDATSSFNTPHKSAQMNGIVLTVHFADYLILLGENKQILGTLLCPKSECGKGNQKTFSLCDISPPTYISTHFDYIFGDIAFTFLEY